MNVADPVFDDGDELTFTPNGAAISAGQFLKVASTGMPDPALNTATDGSPIIMGVCPAGARPTGYADTDVAVGRLGVCRRTAKLVVPMTAGGTIAVGDDLKVGTAGQPITVTANTDIVVGQALTAATVGNPVYVSIL